MNIPGVNGSILMTAYKNSKLKKRYTEGGPIKPFSKIDNISPGADVDYSTGFNVGPAKLQVQGSVNLPTLKQNYLNPKLSVDGKYGNISLSKENVNAGLSSNNAFANANYNIPTQQTSVDAGINKGKFSITGNALLDKTQLVGAGVNANVNVTPNLSLFGDLNWQKTPEEQSTNYNVGFKYSKKFDNGGKNKLKTELAPQEEEEFNKFFRTLPLNLRVDNDSYDVRGYWDALGRPSSFDYSQPKEDDGMYHAFSRHPKSGKMLKSMSHPTAQLAIKGNKEAGYSHAMDPSGNVYSFSPNDMPTEGPYSFARGGQTTGGDPTDEKPVRPANLPPMPADASKVNKWLYNKADARQKRLQADYDVREAADQEAKYVNTPKYAELLTAEFYGPDRVYSELSDEEAAKIDNIITNRRANLKNINLVSADLSKQGIKAGYDPNLHTMYVPKTPADRGVHSHEFSHVGDQSTFEEGTNPGVGTYFTEQVKKGMYPKESPEFLNQPSSLKLKQTVGSNKEQDFNEAEYLQDPSEVKARLRALRDSSIQQGYKLLEPGYDINKYKKGFNQEENKQYDQLKKSGLSDEKINELMYLFAKNKGTNTLVAKKGAKIVETNSNTLNSQRGLEPPRPRPIYTLDKNDPRLKSYDDSLNLYKAYKFQKENTNYMPSVNETVTTLNKMRPELRMTPAKLIQEREKNAGKIGQTKPLRKNAFNYSDPNLGKGLDPLTPADAKVYNYLKSLKFNEPTRIGQYSSPDIVHKRIKPVGEYFDGIALSPVYKKPVQPVIYKSPEAKPTQTTQPVSTPVVEKLSIAPTKSVSSDTPSVEPASSIKSKLKAKKFEDTKTKGGYERLLELENGETLYFPTLEDYNDWESNNEVDWSSAEIRHNVPYGRNLGDPSDIANRIDKAKQYKRKVTNSSVGMQMGGMSIPRVNGTVVSTGNLYSKYKNRK